jgi:hypothetical protein
MDVGVARCVGQTRRAVFVMAGEPLGHLPPGLLTLAPGGQLTPNLGGFPFTPPHPPGSEKSLPVGGCHNWSAPPPLHPGSVTWLLGSWG